MEVKTNTKEKFHVITVTCATLTADMAAKLSDLLLSYLQYENNSSFVVCEMQKAVENFLDSVNLLELMNSTPTESEAMDIVQMEEIEREFLNEE
jgi:hypothetical protein